MVNERSTGGTAIGTALTPGATRLMLLGAGELGKEVAIAAQRLGVEVIAADRYADAPAMQVAHHSVVVDMLDGDALEAAISRYRPSLVVPEIEAIATDRLVTLEAAGLRVVPTARATRLTMDREGIRRLAAEELGVPTSPYRFAGSEAECIAAVAAIGAPCVVKPVMSSSGKGQVLVRDATAAAEAWQAACAGGRAGRERVIVEGFVEFDFEITLLTVRHAAGVAFCPPIGHRQEEGDYRESWQPQPMSPVALAAAEEIAARVTAALGGHGLFGVELFIRGEEVLFSEVSPRPHDTGLVTLAAQDLSQFDLHVRAILGLPVPDIALRTPAASVALVFEGHGVPVRFHGLDAALAVPGTDLRLFGKPSIAGRRRLGVILASAPDVEQARARATQAAAAVTVTID